MNQPTHHPVYRSLNRELTVFGCERKLFFASAVIGAATFTAFNSFWGGIVMWLALYILARWVTAYDPQILRILLNSARFRRRYDPAKCSLTEVEIG